MTVSDLINQTPLPGDELRDLASRLLSFRFGPPEIEHRDFGKKVDIKFKFREFNKERAIFVESKDYSSKLTRDDVVKIYADYSGILDRNKPSSLLIVTRNGVTTDAGKYINEERFDLTHQTIWELENEILGLTEYVRYLRGMFGVDGLESYYVESKGCRIKYASDDIEDRKRDTDRLPIFNRIESWVEESGVKPIAVLGGYGAGKSSLAKRIASHFANHALKSTDVRIPIFVKLGQFSRFANVESLIGGMFSADFPVRGFNIQLFMDSLKRGRFLIICDGFDEMKHAMSWSDFRATVAEVIKLNEGDSKLLILGRPNAFMSLDEHLQVLQGRRKFGLHYRRLSEWPEFEEWELSEFDEVERAEFIGKYLNYSISKNADGLARQDEIESRIAKVKELASADPEVFSKPVHAQILTDLGADFDFDIGSIDKRITRWELYRYFFDYLAERESKKEARRPVSDKDRLDFLREIAFWLFTKRSGSTSFSNSDLPHYIIDNLDLNENDDPEVVAREYLTGAFLEKKAGDIFFFGHRSFAEFLVADRLLNNNPTAIEHGAYSSLLQGSVLDFFEEGLQGGQLDMWARSFTGVGLIDLHYVRWLSHHCGNFRALKAALPKDGLASKLLEQFDDNFHFGPVAEKRLIRSAPTEGADLFYASLKVVDISMSCRDLDVFGTDHSILSDLARIVASNETYTRNSFKLDTIKQEITVDGVALRSLVDENLERLGLRFALGNADVPLDGWPATFVADLYDKNSGGLFRRRRRR